MQYFEIKENKMNDEMDCSVDNPTINVNTFIPKTEFDYLLLGCLLESQQNSQYPPTQYPTQSSPNTLRAISMYQRQFENHKKKSSSTFNRSPLNQYPQNLTNSQINIQNQLFHNYGTTQGIILQPTNVNVNANKFNAPYPVNNNQKQLTNTNNDPQQKTKIKDKKKPKRPNKVKLQGCEWCKVVSSPVWRGGPSGKGSLCNACGLQYMKGFTMERAKETLRKSRGEWKVNSQL